MRSYGASSVFHVAWVIPTLESGGIGPACRYAAEGAAKLLGCRATIVSLHEERTAYTDEATGVNYVGLGLTEEAPQGFLHWLEANPPDIIITNDVSAIESSFPFFPPGVIHVVQIHDSGTRYQDVAVRNSPFIDGVVCVAHYIEPQLRNKLAKVGFNGLFSTVHNGASFPPVPSRSQPSGPLQLLFMGRMAPLGKGIFDLVPILDRTVKAGTPVMLVIAGGQDNVLAAQFKRKKLDHLVTWLGRVPHRECYNLASQSDIFLLPSRREPFGMVTIEAMCMGCVPLAYDIPSGSREIIEHNKSGFLLPLGDFDAWGATIKSLHNDRKRLLELSNCALSRARENFNNEKQAVRLIDFLRQVKVNSVSHPPTRRAGSPDALKQTTRRFKYSQLPPSFRTWIRNAASRSPHLSYWLLNR